MSKTNLSITDVEKLGLLKKRVIAGETWWSYASETPAWVYKYIFRNQIIDMHTNPLISIRCANWLRFECPEVAVALGLADRVMFDAFEYMLPTRRMLEKCGAQFRDTGGVWRIALEHPDCPASMIQYALTRHAEDIDRASASIRSDVFMGLEFTRWVCEYDHDLAAQLGLGRLYAEAP